MPVSVLKINLLKFILFFIPFWVTPTVSTAQLILYQDIFKGGITGGGFSTMLGSGTGEIELSIAENSVVRRAYLICHRYGSPEPIEITLNSVPFLFDGTNQFSEDYNIPNSGTVSPSAVHVLDITTSINPNELIYEVTIPMQLNEHVGDMYNVVYMLVAYEHPDMADVAGSIAVNNQDLVNYENYHLENLNPIDIDHPVGLAIHSDRLRDTLPPVDGSFIFLNNQYLGVIGGADNVNSLWNTGVKGHFYYQNNQLFGLDDDIPNSSMGGSDGLANISGFITAQSTDIEIDMQWQNFDVLSAYNIYISFHLAYTTPCLPFETTLTEEVTTCRGDTAHLLATGGIEYEWLPQEDLSCYNCPNPVFEGDSSKIYTVRIWSTDSCNKVLPVKVNVLDAPHSANLSTTPATCSLADGVLSINGVSGGQPSYQYNIGSGWTGNATANMFSVLEAGDYTFTVRDQNQCYYSQDFTIDEINPAHAAFTANPPTGTEPLNVQFNNQSSGTNQYEWSINNNTLNVFDTTYTFDTAGTYPVQLISWFNEPHCADTATATIIVHPAPPDYSHSIFMATLYNTQHGDFLIETTNVQRVEFDLYNAIGQHILNTEREVNDGVNGLFNGSKYARGYYFFRLKYWDVQGLEFKERGKLLLVR